MIQFQVLSGKQVGSDTIARRFPFVIGRDPSCNWCVDDPGVWDRHLEIRFVRSEGFAFTTQQGASVQLNSEPSGGGFLHNGDVLDLGSLKIRFWLQRAARKSTRMREALTWTLLILLFGAQLALIYALLQ